MRGCKRAIFNHLGPSVATFELSFTETRMKSIHLTILYAGEFQLLKLLPASR